MKKVLSVLGTFILFFMFSCEGPAGPPGFDGLDGEQGPPGEDGLIAQVFEVEGVNFEYLVEANLYSSILAFQDFTSFDVLPEDAVFVYRFDGTVEFEDGSIDNLWSLIPQSFFLPEGTIQYTNAHTSKDVEILIDANYDISNLSTDFTADQIFRIVIVPGEAATAKMDTSNISSVMSALGIDEKDVKKFKLN